MVHCLKVSVRIKLRFFSKISDGVNMLFWKALGEKARDDAVFKATEKYKTMCNAYFDRAVDEIELREQKSMGHIKNQHSSW